MTLVQVSFCEYPLDGKDRLFVFSTSKFKTILVRVYLQRQLSPGWTLHSLLPMVLRRGTSIHPTTAELARFLESLFGARLGTDVLKTGERQSALFEVDVINERFAASAKDCFGKGLELLREVLLSPRVENGWLYGPYVEQERTNLRHELEGLINDRRGYALARCIEAMCAGEPFALRRLGSLSELQDVSSESLSQYHQRFAHSLPATIYVVGDLQPEHVYEEVISRLYWSRTGSEELGPPAIPHETSPEVKRVVEHQNVKQAVLVMGFSVPVTYRSPSPAYESLVFFNALFGGFAHSRLFREVRENAGLAYFVFSRLESTKGLMFVVAGVDQGAVAQTENIVAEQLQNLGVGSVTDEEMEATRISLISRYKMMQDSQRSLIDSHYMGVVNGLIRTPQSMVRTIESLGKEDIAAVAQSVTLDTVFTLTGR